MVCFPDLEPPHAEGGSRALGNMESSCTSVTAAVVFRYSVFVLLAVDRLLVQSCELSEVNEILRQMIAAIGRCYASHRRPTYAGTWAATMALQPCRQPFESQLPYVSGCSDRVLRLLQRPILFLNSASMPATCAPGLPKRIPDEGRDRCVCLWTS